MPIKSKQQILMRWYGNNSVTPPLKKERTTRCVTFESPKRSYWRRINNLSKSDVTRRHSSLEIGIRVLHHDGQWVRLTISGYFG